MAVSDMGESDPPPTVEGILNDAQEAKLKLNEFFEISTTEIRQILEKIRSDAAEADRLKTEVATLKGNAEALHLSANADADAIVQIKASVEAIKSGAVAISTEIAERVEAARTSFIDLEERQRGLAPILVELESLKVDAEEKRSGVEINFKEVEKLKSGFDDLAAKAVAAQEAVTKEQKALKIKIDEIESANQAIAVLHKALFEDSGDTNCVETQIANLSDRLVKTVEGAAADRASLTAESTRQRNELFSSLEKKILALLPSAGAAGLAYTYYDAKSRYSPTSYAGAPGGKGEAGIMSLVRKLFSYNPASIVATITFYTLFLFPLAIVALGSFQLLQRLENDPHFVLTYQMLGLRLLIAIPLATISGFGFASLRRYQKLYEEYNHKQRVMELYESFKKEVDVAGSAEQKKLLLSIMLNSVASKASDVAKDEEGVDNSAAARLEKWSNLIIKMKSAAG